MGVYDGLPYELQSPRWRSAMNYADTGKNEWNPTLNENMTMKILDASRDVARYNAQGVTTTQIDGQSRFVDSLSSFGSALLQSIGVRPEQPAPQVQPVGWREPARSGFDTQTLLVLALVGVGAYVALGKG